MALSQFTQYTNFDVGDPSLNGITGSLIDVLDFCLVSGSGWLRTFNSSSADGREVYAVYQQPSGSGMYLFVNDSGPGALTIAGKEAWVCGWEMFTNMTGSLSSSSNTANPNPTSSIGGGWGQFPLRIQAVQNVTGKTEGGLVVRKSVTATAISRNWQVFADAYTFYMFVQSEGTSAWWAWWFGDIYSFAGASDMYRCILRANSLYNVTGTSTRCISDQIHTLNIDVNNSDGMYMPRHVSGQGFSVLVHKGSPYINANGGGNSKNMAGQIPAPNPINNSYIIAPITVFESNWAQSATAARKPMRGRMRGFWHYCHPVTTAVNGQLIYGTGEYEGKTFQVISPGVGNSGGGVFLIERSATVETN